MHRLLLTLLPIGLALGLVLAGCRNGGDEMSSDPEDHPSIDVVNGVAEEIRAALAIDVDDGESVTEECRRDIDGGGRGTFTTTRFLSADGVEPAVLDPLPTALSDARVVSDRPITDGIGDTAIGRIVELTIERDGITAAISGAVRDRSLSVRVESSCA